jgi:hypothetical protein
LSNIAVGNNVPQPKELPIPEELVNLDDQILDIHCSKRHSFILTQKGVFWATGGIKEEKQAKMNFLKNLLGAASDEEDIESTKDSKKGKNEKGKKGKN